MWLGTLLKNQFQKLSSFAFRFWGLRKWRHLTSVVLRRLGISKYFKIHVDSITLIFHPAAVTSHLWENTDAFNEDRDFLKRYLKAGDIFVDVGANVGLLSLTASSLVGKEGCVFSAEAHPQTFWYLTENIRINRVLNVRAFHSALGASVGTVSISNEPEDEFRHILLGERGIKVDQTTLDRIAKGLSVVNLLKLDVEGYEFEVLLGSMRMLTITQCIYFESCDYQIMRYGHKTSELCKYLLQKGFLLFSLPSAGGTIVRPVFEDHTSPEVENLIAIRNVKEFSMKTGFVIP
jgi:FkbM family methyltransferase